MKLVFVILILCAVLNAEESEFSQCASDFQNCNDYATDLETKNMDLQKAVTDRTKERDEAVSLLGKESPPILPWYAYLCLGFVAGGLTAAVALK